MTDLHVHTCYCDGLTYPDEYVKAAILKGVSCLGLLAHSFVPFDTCCMRLERYDEFIRDVGRLRKKYAGKIDILCGIEQDLYSPATTDGFDYVIGSVHYIRHGEQYISVDETPEILKEMIDKFYCGDFYACAEDYYNNVAMLSKIRPNIVGHFDLIKKFRKMLPFDENNERYRRAWISAAEKLIECGCTFEINTGGIVRGYLDEPYPSPDILEYIKKRGAKLILSSDAHRPEDIAFGFERFNNLI